MIPPRKHHPTKSGLRCILLSVLLCLPPIAWADLVWIPLGECALNGFFLGGTVDAMREALGEPDRSSLVKPPGNDYPNTEYEYEGLRIEFSTHGRSAIRFTVTSGDFRLRNGLGVGSSREEIESALGPASELRSGDDLYLYYGLNAPSGQPGFGQLGFRMENGLAVEITAGWPSR